VAIQSTRETASGDWAEGLQARRTNVSETHSYNGPILTPVVHSNKAVAVGAVSFYVDYFGTRKTSKFTHGQNPPMQSGPYIARPMSTSKTHSFVSTDSSLTSSIQPGMSSPRRSSALGQKGVPIRDGINIPSSGIVGTPKQSMFRFIEGRLRVAQRRIQTSFACA